VSAFGIELTRLMSAQDVGVHELARRSHYTPGYISNLRAGRKTPSREAAAELDALLHAEGRLLRTLRPPDEAVAEIGYALPLVDQLTSEAIELGRLAEIGTVGNGTIEQLDDAITRVARDHLICAPEPLLRRAAAISSHVRQLLGAQQRLRHTRGLMLVGAKAQAFLAAVCGDLGQQAAAAAHARTALILAQEAGHPGTVAVALSALSKVAFWDGNERHAADLARSGFGLCPPNSTRVLLACQEADAAALPAAQEAVTRAERAEDEITADDVLPGLYSCGPGRRAGYAMTYHLRAGQPAKVLAAGIIADQGHDDGQSYGTWAQVQINAALAHLANRSIDGAAHRLAPVLALPPHMRLATFDGKLARALVALGRPAWTGSGEARNLSAEIDAYLVDRGSTIPYPLGLENRSGDDHQ
jgi:transcriptional regulator with XRE-family HTH domain